MNKESLNLILQLSDVLDVDSLPRNVLSTYSCLNLLN